MTTVSEACEAEGVDDHSEGEVTGEEEETCVEVESDSNGKLELFDISELHFYCRLFNLIASLTELYAMPQLMDNAKELEGWLSQASDGLVLACISSFGEASSDGAETTIMNEIHINTSCNPMTYTLQMLV